MAAHPDTVTDLSAMTTVGPSGQDRLPDPARSQVGLAVLAAPTPLW
ncbi:MAG TPA: hypothetical protein VLG91_21540 [Streptomyces sp.]|nr:hypothetical protein [Streptomyces sp.]